MFLRRPYLPEMLRCTTKQWKIIRSASSNQHLVISQPRRQRLSFSSVLCYISWAYHCLWKVVCRRIRSNVNGSYEIELKGRGRSRGRGDKHQRGAGSTWNCSQGPLLPAQQACYVYETGAFPQQKEAEGRSCLQVLWPLADKYWRIFQSSKFECRGLLTRQGKKLIPPELTVDS